MTVLLVIQIQWILDLLLQNLIQGGILVRVLTDGFGHVCGLVLGQREEGSRLVCTQSLLIEAQLQSIVVAMHFIPLFMFIRMFP